MTKEIVIVKQEIHIEYNNEEARELAISELQRGTNWFAISEGTIRNEKNQYELIKGKVLSIDKL